MSRSLAQEAISSRTGAAKIARPPTAKTTSVAFEAFCRKFSGSQTAIPEIPSSI